MLAQELEFGFLVVIKQDFLPVAFDVATFAFCAEVSFMRLVVFLLVT